MSWRAAKRRLVAMLAGGMSPNAIALCVAVGIVFGVCPIFGLPTVLCTVAALLLRLNLPAIQAVNYMVYPAQIALFLPFMHLGGRLFQSPASAANVIATAWHTAAAWLCVCVPAGFLLYGLLVYVLRTRGGQLSAWVAAQMPLADRPERISSISEGISYTA